MPNTPYQLLKSPQEIDDLLKPEAGRHLVFKHSLTCPVSHAAFREFERFLATAVPAGTQVGLIEVQNARPASNRVAERTGVRHESPQALLVENGVVRWHRSHWDITEKSLALGVGGRGQGETP